MNKKTEYAGVNLLLFSEIKAYSIGIQIAIILQLGSFPTHWKDGVIGRHDAGSYA